MIIQDEGSRNISLHEKTNIDAISFLKTFKRFQWTIMEWVITHNKLPVIAWVFTIKSHYSLRGAKYDSIIEWVKNMLLEGNRLKENFYVAKFMMKPLGLWYQKIDTCSKFYMLYYDEYANFIECKTC